MAPFKSSRQNHKLLITTGLIILAAASSVGIYRFASNVPSIRNAVTLATTAKPETFTELYFEDHSNLPKTIEKYKEYSFSFTIHNLEYKDVEYPYIVYLQSDSDKIILDSGKLSLKNDEYKSQKEDFGPLESPRAKVVVELTNKNQQIDFWMEEQ
jgi:hypothetical protein